MLKPTSTRRACKEALQTGNMESNLQDFLPLKVLLIVDSTYGVIGNFAKQIPPKEVINFSACSAFPLKQAIKRLGPLTLPFDVLHYLAGKPIEQYVQSLLTVTTLHHIKSKTNTTKFFKRDAVMTVSEQWRKHHIDMGLAPEQVLLVPFGVGILQFIPPTDDEREKIRTALHIPNGAFVVGFSGKSTSDRDNRKDLHCFIQGLKQLRQSLPTLTTLLIGPGWRKLGKLLIQGGIPCIQSSYHLNHQEIAQYYRAMDVYWVTSKIKEGRFLSWKRRHQVCHASQLPLVLH